ncbi:hypothetical protein I4F81_003765 [Pyropia yezoensis]|uniref:Uncharacterized protein n=1 Tax=Pyropia yezoensis TaxID=2788 RepID=A0ACC3BT29_PYRYE|nr:hypothetical protein I4F81_003765 [Neopyropia yezoensis]
MMAPPSAAPARRVTDLVSALEATEADAAASATAVATAAAATRAAADVARTAREEAAAAHAAAAEAAAAAKAAAAADKAAAAAAVAPRSVAFGLVPAPELVAAAAKASAAVVLVGNWQGWDLSRGVALAPPGAVPSGGGGGGRWTTEVALPPGLYQYKYVVGGSWVVDREQPTVMDGYHENNTAEVL